MNRADQPRLLLRSACSGGAPGKRARLVVAASLAALVTLTSAGCSPGANGTGDDGPVTVTSVYSDAQCGHRRAGASALGSTDAVARFPADGEGTLPSRIAHELDFDQRLVAVVSMGQQRTGGYAVRLASDQARLEEGTITVPVEWHQPAPDAMTTQALTRPCLAVALPRDGYERVLFVDGSGEVRARMTAPADD